MAHGCRPTHTCGLTSMGPALTADEIVEIGRCNSASVLCIMEPLSMSMNLGKACCQTSRATNALYRPDFFRANVTWNVLEALVCQLCWYQIYA